MSPDRAAVAAPLARAVGLDRAVVLAELDAVPDPEIPRVSIVQLGMIGDVEVDAGAIRVELLPTFVGCPALELIRDSIVERLARFARPVEVRVSYATPWTSDRITPAGREGLRSSGVAPPPRIGVARGRSLPVLESPPAGAAAAGAAATSDDPTPCPYCGSYRTTLVSPFGPTQCRTVHHCADCRQPFEGFKAV